MGIEAKESAPVIEPKLWFGLSAKVWFLVFLTLFFVGQSIKYAMKVSEKDQQSSAGNPKSLASILAKTFPKSISIQIPQ